MTSFQTYPHDKRMFEVGDRVRINAPGLFKHGLVGTIARIDVDDWLVAPGRVLHKVHWYIVAVAAGPTFQADREIRCTGNTLERIDDV